jgi:hypothetical protein
MGISVLPSRRLFERGPLCRGLAIDTDGVALGPSLALVWREGQDFRAADKAEVGLLLRKMFRDRRDPEVLTEILANIAAALERNDLLHAQMLGLQTEFAGLDFGRLDDWRERAARLAKYDPEQPRVAAGSGRTSGQWTSSGGEAAAGQGVSQEKPAAKNYMRPPNSVGRLKSVAPTVKPALAISRAFWSWLVEAAPEVAGRTIAALGLLIPNLRDVGVSATIPGRPDLVLEGSGEDLARWLYQVGADGQ